MILVLLLSFGRERENGKRIMSNAFKKFIMLSLVRENVQNPRNSVSPQFLDSLSLKFELRDEENYICESSLDFSNWTTALLK